MRYELHHGDNRAVLKTMPDNSIDSIVCDPPYELGFMGKRWDASGIAYDTTLWTECLRVLKPGGHLIAFGGTRTYHRMTVAIEDAGFEIRDSIIWMYGSGFPKSLDVSKAIDKQAGAEREVVGKATRHGGGKSQIIKGDYNPPITAPATPEAQHWHGWGTAIKPAHEPAVLARKPLTGTVADNVLTWGTGALNIDGSRVGSSGGTQWVSDGVKGDEGQFGGGIKDGKIASINTGRWPANVILDEHAAEALDEQSGHSVSKPHVQYKKAIKSIAKGYESARIDEVNYNDSGGASRFFYIAKASRAEREAGLDAPPGERANIHPTLKPITLMRHLVRLVTPKGGVVLDPFMGSGSTGCAAMLEGMRFVGIDITAEYVDIAERRIQHWLNQNPMEL
jgi:site-specific DNA-methyltransferase (adenine-specific)